MEISTLKHDCQPQRLLISCFSRKKIRDDSQPQFDVNHALPDDICDVRMPDDARQELTTYMLRVHDAIYIFAALTNVNS